MVDDGDASVVSTSFSSSMVVSSIGDVVSSIDVVDESSGSVLRRSVEEISLACVDGIVDVGIRRARNVDVA